MKSVGIVLLLAGLPGLVFGCATPIAPEVDATSAMTAVVLVSGAVLVIRGRRKSK
jgi:hypothetical protein